MGAMRNTFDFGAMEDFAGKEKETQARNDGTWIPDGARRRSGASVKRTDHHPGSYDTAMDRTATMSPFGDERDTNFGSPPVTADHQPFNRRRQRKLSQSNPVKRQGKLAMFEGFGSGNTGPEGESALDTSNGTPFKAPRQPKNALAGSNGANGFTSYTDAPPGHDRPYRFSFYSNALPVTIHARSLAELPAEGQTFEDLFKGKNDNPEIRREKEEIGTEYGSIGGNRNGGIDTPVTAATTEPSTGTTAGGKMSMLAKAAGAAMSNAVSKLGGGGDSENALQSETYISVIPGQADSETGLRHSSVNNRRYSVRGDP